MMKDDDRAIERVLREHDERVAHTPGPWYYDEGDNGEITRDVPEGSPLHEYGTAEMVAVATEHRDINGGADGLTPRDHETMKANARLIAAAPDLLVSLGLLVSAVDEFSAMVRNQMREEMSRALDAIAKATGDDHA
jgi:flagellar basal body rod protein FlgF